MIILNLTLHHCYEFQKHCFFLGSRLIRVIHLCINGLVKYGVLGFVKSFDLTYIKSPFSLPSLVTLNHRLIPKEPKFPFLVIIPCFQRISYLVVCVILLLLASIQHTPPLRAQVYDYRNFPQINRPYSATQVKYGNNGTGLAGRKCRGVSGDGCVHTT